MPPGQKAPGHGAFHLQYTNAAHDQLKRMDSALCATVQEKLRIVAASDPYAHGAADPRTDHRDRRIVVVEGLLVTLWVAAPVRILTVINIHESRGGPCEPHWPEPAGPAMEIEAGRPGPFTDGDDEDDEEIYVGQMAGAR